MKEPPRIFTEKQAAAEINISVAGLRKLRYSGKVPYLKIGRRCVRLDMDDVWEALRRMEVKQ